MEAMHNLRLLSLNNAIIKGDFGRIPTSELRWLRWIDCPLECLPSELKMKNIAVLEVTQSRQIRQVWVDEQMHPKIPKTLKILRVADCFNLERLPEFSKLRSLVKLELFSCNRLESLPDSIGGLENLKYLELSYCDGLRSIPELPKLQSLVKLMLHSCHSLTVLPDSIGVLESLKYLELSYCDGLRSIPELPKLQSLVKLMLHSCQYLTALPDSIGGLENLKHLDLSHCDGLRSIPELPKLQSLVKLMLRNCQCLTALLDSIGGLENLNHLDLSHCYGLRSIPELPKLQSLVKLMLHNCQCLTALPDSIGNLINLEYLDLSYCYGLRSIPELPKLQSLVKLMLYNCQCLTALPDSIGNLINLEYLDLSSCKNLEGLPRSIGSLVRLRFLIMYKNCSLRCLPEEFGRLLQLEELNLSECETLVELPQSFGNLSNLTVLRMNNMRNLTRPPESISDLGALRILEVQRASRLQELPNIGMLKSLGLLNLSYNCFHTLPESIIHLSQLTKLRLSHYSNLSKLPVLPERLVELVIEKCGYLRRVPDLSNLKHLEILVMYECKRVEGLPGLGSLQALVYLDIGRCYDIKSVAGVEGLKSLQRLHLGGSGVAFFHKWIKVMPRLWELSFDAKPFRDWFSQQIQTAPPSLDENGEYITFLEQGQNVRCMGAIFFFVGIQLSVSVIRGGRYAFSSTQFTSRTSFNRYRDFGGEEMRLFICQENDEFIKSLQNGDKIRFGVDENVTSPIVWINFLSSTGEEIIRSGSEDSSKQQNSKLYCEFFRDMAWIQWSYNAWRNLHPLDFNMRSFAVYDLAGFIRRTFNSKSLGSGNVVQETVFVRCKRELWFEVEGELVEKDKKLSGGKSDRWMEWKKQSERERERVRRVRRREMVGMQERPSMRVGYATASGCARTVVNTICEKVAQIRKVSRTWYGRMDQEEHLGQLYSQGRTVAPVPSGTQIKLATSLTRLSRS